MPEFPKPEMRVVFGGLAVAIGAEAVFVAYPVPAGTAHCLPQVDVGGQRAQRVGQCRSIAAFDEQGVHGKLRELVAGSVTVAEEHGAEEPPAVFGDVLDMFVRSTSGWIDSRRGSA